MEQWLAFTAGDFWALFAALGSLNALASLAARVGVNFRDSLKEAARDRSSRSGLR